LSLSAENVLGKYQYRYSYLLLDEMSISGNVWFNQKFDCVEGFEDLGSRGRMCDIANGALLFMVCGLQRKWKWPVAYYLSHGSTKAEMLVQFLNEILGACYNVRLHNHMVCHPRCVFINYNWINQLSNTPIWWLDICCLLHGINYMFRLLWPSSG